MKILENNVNYRQYPVMNAKEISIQSKKNI